MLRQDQGAGPCLWRGSEDGKESPVGRDELCLPLLGCNAELTVLLFPMLLGWLSESIEGNDHTCYQPPTPCPVAQERVLHRTLWPSFILLCVQILGGILQTSRFGASCFLSARSMSGTEEEHPVHCENCLLPNACAVDWIKTMSRVLSGPMNGFSLKNNHKPPPTLRLWGGTNMALVNQCVPPQNNSFCCWCVLSFKSTFQLQICPCRKDWIRQCVVTPHQ